MGENLMVGPGTLNLVWISLRDIVFAHSTTSFFNLKFQMKNANMLNLWRKQKYENLFAVLLLEVSLFWNNTRIDGSILHFLHPGSDHCLVNFVFFALFLFDVYVFVWPTFIPTWWWTPQFCTFLQPLYLRLPWHLLLLPFSPEFVFVFCICICSFKLQLFSTSRL